MRNRMIFVLLFQIILVQFILVFQIVQCKTASPAGNWINNAHQTEATTFAISSVFILLVCSAYCPIPGTHIALFQEHILPFSRNTYCPFPGTHIALFQEHILIADVMVKCWAQGSVYSVPALSSSLESELICMRRLKTVQQVLLPRIFAETRVEHLQWWWCVCVCVCVLEGVCISSLGQPDPGKMLSWKNYWSLSTVENV